MNLMSTILHNLWILKLSQIPNDYTYTTQILCNTKINKYESRGQEGTEEWVEGKPPA